jgi:hypothetical protein
MLTDKPLQEPLQGRRHPVALVQHTDEQVAGLMTVCESRLTAKRSEHIEGVLAC